MAKTKAASAKTNSPKSRSDRTGNAGRLVTELLRVAPAPHYAFKSIAKLPQIKAILKGDARLHVDVIREAATRARRSGPSPGAVCCLAMELLRRKLPLEEEDVLHVIDEAVRDKRRCTAMLRPWLPAMVRWADRQTQNEQGLSRAMKGALARLAATIRHANSGMKVDRDLAYRIDLSLMRSPP